MELALVVKTVHVIGAMAWVGSLLFLAAVLFPYLRSEFGDDDYRELSVEVGRRFQIFGWTSILVLGMTGIANIYLRFGTLAVEPGSEYGTALLLKVGLFLLLVAFTIYHSYRSTKTDGREGSGVAAYAMLLTTVAIVFTAVYLGSRFV